MSSRESLTLQQPHDSDEPYTTSFRLKNEARQHLRTRPRCVIMFLIAIAILSVILFSQQHLLPANYLQRYEDPLDLETSFDSDLDESLPVPTNMVTPTSPSIHTVVVEPPVDPVVFALIIYSESSAKEGAILLKVYFPGSTIALFSADDKAH
jgi:hypothetical protein